MSVTAQLTAIRSFVPLWPQLRPSASASEVTHDVRGCMLLLTRACVRRWASPLHVAFDWGGFESLKYARTGWRDTPLAPFDGIVCDSSHLTAQNLLDGIEAVLSPSPSRTHTDAHAMEPVLSRTHAQAQGRQALLDSSRAELDSTHAEAVLSSTHESGECASESSESSDSAPTHATRHHACDGHSKEEAGRSKEEAGDGHSKEQARELSAQQQPRQQQPRQQQPRQHATTGQEEARASVESHSTLRYATSSSASGAGVCSEAGLGCRSGWPAGRFGDYAFAVCNLCQLRRLDCGCRDVSTADTGGMYA